MVTGLGSPYVRRFTVIVPYTPVESEMAAARH